MVMTKWGIPIVANKVIPRGEYLVLGDINEPVYSSMGERCVLVHPTTYLRLKYPRSPVWSMKTLGHREAEIDRRRYG